MSQTPDLGALTEAAWEQARQQILALWDEQLPKVFEIVGHKFMDELREYLDSNKPVRREGMSVDELFEAYTQLANQAGVHMGSRMAVLFEETVAAYLSPSKGQR